MFGAIVLWIESWMHRSDPVALAAASVNFNATRLFRLFDDEKSENNN